MNQVNFDQILSKIRTTDEANRFLQEIDIILDSYFEVSEEKKKEIFDKKLSYPTSQMLNQILQNLNNDHSQFEAFLKKLKSDIKALKVLKLTIAFEPTDATIDLTYQWAISNIGKNVLVDIATNPGILGGAEISFGGKYKDMTVRTEFDNYFKNKSLPQLI